MVILWLTRGPRAQATVGGGECWGWRVDFVVSVCVNVNEHNVKGGMSSTFIDH